MAEENLENQEQEQKTQYSIEQIEALIAKVNDLEVEVASLNKALHKKQMKKAKEEMRAQAKADAIVACAKYKVNKEDADKVVEDITARYEAEYEKIKTEYEEKGEEIRSQHEKNEDEYDELLIKESKARKAYREEKKSKEYKEFMAENKKIQDSISFLENNKDIAPENVEEIVGKLKAIADKNPLNKYAEELKGIEDRKKEVIAANKELEAKMKDLEDKFDKQRDELGVNKNKEVAEANKDAVKPGFFQRLSNFFTSPAKRKEIAEKEAEKKSDETIETLKARGGFDGKSITGVKDFFKGKISTWRENRKQKKMDKINEIVEQLAANYKENPEGKGDESKEFGGVKVEPVPEGKGAIIDDDTGTIVHMEEEPAAMRPGSAAVEKSGTESKPKTGTERTDGDEGR